MSRFRFFEVLQIIMILSLSFAFSFFVPPLTLKVSTGTVVEILVLFSFLLGFFVNRALERKRMVAQGTSLELLRLRRIWHLCENVSNKPWAQRLFLGLEKYHTAVSDSFLLHASTTEHFRNVSHLIYSYKPKNKKDEILLLDLLNTTRDLTLERQQIEQALVNGLSGYSWMVMLTNAGFAIILLMMNRYEPQYSPLGSAFAISAILLLFDLLLRTDRFSKSEINGYKDLYKDNLPHKSDRGK